MEYSEENLVKLLSQVSAQARQGSKQKRTGKVGYPNCPGPGCGNNCPYKGTSECPKAASGNPGGEKKYEGHDENMGHGRFEKHDGHKGHGGREGREGHGQGMRHGHGGHGDSQWYEKDGRANERGGQDAQSPMGRERILALLDKAGSLSQRKLAEELDIRPQSVSELLVKLEKDGYITRTQNEQDKREILVSLSEEGKKRAGEVKDLEEKQTADFLAPLDEEERKTLFSLLTKLTNETAKN